MINMEVTTKNWSPITTGKKGMQVSHLLFADDMILFSKASISQMEVVTKCLDAFYEQSRLKGECLQNKNHVF